jgi:chorismate synthase
MENAILKVRGRHDPCIVPRAVPCVEAAAAIAIYDALLEYKKYKGVI